MHIGAKYSGGICDFVVWAPLPEELRLMLARPGETAFSRINMERDDSGYWRASVDAPPGSRYLFSLDGAERADPASHYQPLGVEGPSEVVDHSYSWNDSSWKGLFPASMVIYEIHAGAFTAEGRLDSIVPRLDDLKDLGVNALELMPVGQFPGKRNWGYDGVFPFAVQDSYGGPAALKSLVDECHQRGMAVVLDVVYNHFGPEGNYIAEFGPYFTDRYNTPWGKAINFDSAHSDHVRNFFIENALFWFKRYHIDALRIDAVHAMLDFSARPFLKSLEKRVREFSDSSGRRCCVFAESDLNDTRIVCGGEYAFGLDALWCDDFHHSVHALVTGERDGYYADFGFVWQLVKAINEGFVYSGQYSVYRQRSFGSQSAHIPRERFIAFVQNHDQIGNRMLGERLSRLTSFEGLKLAAGLLMLSPYIPLIFMGEEYGEESPFLYFIDHSDERLRAAVRAGRMEEFKEFSWLAEPPVPESEDTFKRSVIDWDKRNAAGNRTLLAFYKTLIKIRREAGAFAAIGATTKAWGDEDKLVLYMERGNDAEKAFAMFNFNRIEIESAGFPQGRWVKSIDSAEAAWEGPGSSLPAVAEQAERRLLKPLSFALYIKEEA